MSKIGFYSEKLVSFIFIIFSKTEIYRAVKIKIIVMKSKKLL